MALKKHPDKNKGNPNAGVCSARSHVGHHPKHDG